MDSKKPIYKSTPFWIVALFLLYSALGFFTVPYLIKKELRKLSENQLNSSLSVENISFNPFTISAEISKLKLTDKDKTTWFRADTIYANINLWKTLFSNTSIAKVFVNNPYFHVVMSNNKGNPSLKYPRISPSKENEVTSTLLLDINSIEINQGAIDYDDDSGIKHLSLKLKEIVFDHQGFTTKDEDTHFNLKFVTEDNSTTEIDGQFNFPQVKLNGKWNLSNWTTATIFNIISDEKNEFLGFKNQSGIINASGTVNYFGSQQKLPTLNVNTLSLQDFTTLQSNETEPQLSLQDLSLKNISVDLNQENIVIDSVEGNDFDISMTITDENELLWHYLESQATIDNTELETNKEIPSWHYQLNTINLNNTLLNLNKQHKKETTTNALAFNSMLIKNLSNTDGQKFQLKTTLTPDEEGTIEVETEILTSPLEVTANIKAQDTNIAKASAWFPHGFNLTLESGLLSLEQKFSLINKQITAKGWSKISNLVLLDAQNQEFLSISQLDVLDNEIDSDKKIIRLNKIKLDKANGTLTITEDKRFNATNLVVIENSKEAKKQLKTSNQKNEESEWIIEVKEIEINDSTTSFNDKSIKPNFQTELSKFNGSIKGLSSTNLSKADVNLTGTLDTYGKISIKGKINPLSEKAYTDIIVDVENLNLQNLSSYTGKYLGFPIERGKADFNFKYKLNKSMLKGINDLKFKQLKFGNKTNSKDAVSLPLKLAVSLLTDGKGIMKINLPVSGNIDDPKFSYGSLIFKAFFKLITGIVASPFKLLGKLIPGGADLDLSGIQFKAGTIGLNEGEDGKLDAMSKIIQKRPAIILELTGITNSINDKKALQQLQLFEKLNITNSPDFNDGNLANNIKKTYIELNSKDKWLELQQKATSEEVLNIALLTENTYKDLLNSQDVKKQLSLLGKNRALFIQQQLLEKFKIPEDKIFLKASENSDALHPQVKFGVGT